MKGATIGEVINVAGLVNNLNDADQWKNLYHNLIQDHSEEDSKDLLDFQDDR
jgi:hypothetical protein